METEFFEGIEVSRRPGWKETLSLPMEFRFDWGCQGEAPMQRTCLTVALSLAIGVTVHLASGHAATAADDTLQPLITTSELIVGQNRFAFGLASGHGNLHNVGDNG